MWFVIDPKTKAVIARRDRRSDALQIAEFEMQQFGRKLIVRWKSRR